MNRNCFIEVNQVRRLRVPQKALTTIFFALAISTSWGQEVRDTARVTVIATDAFGKAFGNFKVTSFTDEHKKDLSRRFIANAADGVPFGEYWLRIRFDTGGGMMQKVDVYERDCLLILSDNPLHIDSPRGRAPVLNGQIANLPQDFGQPIWIKACGLFIPGCEVSEVGSGGHFSFLNLTPAAYVIAVLSASGNSILERFDVTDPGAAIEFDAAGPAGKRIKETR